MSGAILRRSLGLIVTAASFVMASGLGYALGLVAPGLLGPSYDERIAGLESETARLVERNRLAREIHDSVGHALSLVTIQASAAKRVVDRDRDFVVSALEAIEQTSRSAANDLDHVLGLLRDSGDASRTPAPDLAALDSLVAASRAAGLEVEVTTEGDLTGLATVVSREAYRITQEGLKAARFHWVPSETTTSPALQRWGEWPLHWVPSETARKATPRPDPEADPVWNGRWTRTTATG